MKKPTQIRKLKKENKWLIEMLRDVQWVQPQYNGSPSCSFCGVQKHLHEAVTCDLSKILGDKDEDNDG